MKCENNTHDNNKILDKRCDVDFLTRMSLKELEPYGEYVREIHGKITATEINPDLIEKEPEQVGHINARLIQTCLLYTSPSPRDGLLSRMPSSA